VNKTSNHSNTKMGDYMKKIKIYMIYLILICLVSCSHPNQKPSSNNNTNSISSSQNVADFGSFTNEWTYLTQVFANINEQILPDIVYAILSVSIDGEIIPVKVEIIEDQKNGTRYHVCNHYIDIWVNQSQIEIVYSDDVYPLKPLQKEVLEFYLNYLEFKSETSHFIFVDIKRQMVCVFQQINGYYFLINSFPCATGKTSTPTKRGHFIIKNKGPVFYNEAKYYKCYYWLKYSDKYLLHSVPYSLDGNVLNTSMQKKVSNGCIRMKYKDAKWLYDTIDINTSIWIN